MEDEDNEDKNGDDVGSSDIEQSSKVNLEGIESKAMDIIQPGALDELLDETSLAEKYLAAVLELEATKQELLEVRCLLNEREERHVEQVARLRTRIEMLLENVGVEVAGELAKRKIDHMCSAPYEGLQSSLASRQEVSISSPTSGRDQLATSTPNTTLGTRTDVVSNNLSEMVAGEASFIRRIGSEKKRK